MDLPLDIIKLITNYLFLDEYKQLQLCNKDIYNQINDIFNNKSIIEKIYNLSIFSIIDLLLKIDKLYIFSIIDLLLKK